LSTSHKKRGFGSLLKKSKQKKTFDKMPDSEPCLFDMDDYVLSSTSPNLPEEEPAEKQAAKGAKESNRPNKGLGGLLRQTDVRGAAFGKMSDSVMFSLAEDPVPSFLPGTDEPVLDMWKEGSKESLGETLCTSSRPSSPGDRSESGSPSQENLGNLATLFSMSSHQKSSILAQPFVCDLQHQTTTSDQDNKLGNLKTFLSSMSSHQKPSTILAEPSVCVPRHSTLAEPSVCAQPIAQKSFNPFEDSWEIDSEFELVSLNVTEGGIEGDDSSFVRPELEPPSSYNKREENDSDTEDEQFLQLTLPGMDGYASNTSLGIVEHVAASEDTAFLLRVL
jgi:hypothetical protein